MNASMDRERLAELLTAKIASEFGYPFSETKARRASTLHDLGEAAVPPLARRLGHADARVRVWAARTLSALPGDAPVAALAAALAGPDDHVRLMAAVGLAERKDPRALSPLLALAVRGPPWSRHEALWALGTLGDSSALPVLLRA